MSDQSRIVREAYLLAAEKILRERLNLPRTSEERQDFLSKAVQERKAAPPSNPFKKVAVDEQTRERWVSAVKEYLLREHPEQDFIYKTAGDAMVCAHMDEGEQCLRVWDLQIRSEETIDLPASFFADRYRGRR